MAERKARRRVRVEFGNCDPARIVYYPNYVAWIDQSTHRLFEDVGLSVKDLQDRLGVQVPLVDLSAQFVSPAGWGDEIEIESHVSRLGSKSFEVSHVMTDAATGVVLVKARETRVCVSIDPKAPKAIRSCAIPDEMRAIFG